MKKALFILTMILSLSSSAQMSQLFYGSNISSLPSLQASIQEALPGFHLDSSFVSKSGKSETIIFKDATGHSIEASILTTGGIIGTVQIVGSFEPLMSIYKHYVNSQPALEPGASCLPVYLTKLATGQVMPVSFCQNISKADSWTLANRMPM